MATIGSIWWPGWDQDSQVENNDVPAAEDVAVVVDENGFVVGAAAEDGAATEAVEKTAVAEADHAAVDAESRPEPANGHNQGFHDEVLVIGRFPATDHNGLEFHPKRGQQAGQRLNLRGLCIRTFGDWSWYTEVLMPFHWRQGNFCARCS